MRGNAERAEGEARRLRSRVEALAQRAERLDATVAQARPQPLHVIVQPGELVAIMGPSGAGKSTLVDIALGLLTPDSGSLIVDGLDISESQMRGWQSQIGYVPQSIFLTDDTLARNIAFGVPEERHQ